MTAPIMRVIVVALAAVFMPLSPALSHDEATLMVQDRLEILNVVQSFSHFLDERKFDDWQALFTDDVRFEAFPGDGTRVEIDGKPTLVAFFQQRYEEGSLATGQRRHALSTIRVVEQTEKTAQVKLYVTISMATDEAGLVFVTTGTYGIGLVKTDNGWRANRWQIRSDVKATPPVEILEGATEHMRISPAEAGHP